MDNTLNTTAVVFGISLFALGGETYAVKRVSI